MSLEIYLDNYQNITKNSKTNFLLTFNFLNAHQKKGIYVVYAFSKISDDIVDGNESKEEKIKNLNLWRNKFISRKDSNIDLLKELDRVINHYAIPEKYFLELLDGMYQDINKNRYEDDEELLNYCYLAASTVGLICIHIFGFKNEATINYAINLGKALQLTNIVRDVYTDILIDRIYIPKTDLDKYSVSEEDLINKNYNEKFIKLMKFQYDKAEIYYKRADSYLVKEDKKTMIVAEMMSNIYHAILKKIDKNSFNVFDNKIRINHFSKIIILIRTFFAR